jgi:hypothetical protein
LWQQEHHEARHPSIPFNPEGLEDLHEKFGGTTKGIAVRGTKEFNKLQAKGLTGKAKAGWWEEEEEGKAKAAAAGAP